MPLTLLRAGCPLSYDVAGDGPPVLFIQGVGVNGSGWRPQIDVLSKQYRCLSFDNRGIGASVPKGSEPISAETLADDAIALLDAEGWPDAHVVGHSLGGPVALQIALKAKSRVRSLSLLCTFANGRRAAPLTLRMLSLGMRTKIGTRAMRRRAFLSLIMPKSSVGPNAAALATKLEPLFGHDLADQPPIVSDQLHAMRAFDVSNQLASFASIPTLVISAEHDPIAPPWLGQELSSGIPGSRFVLLLNASHGAPIDMPIKINSLLESHLLQSEAVLKSNAKTETLLKDEAVPVR